MIISPLSAGCSNVAVKIKRSRLIWLGVAALTGLSSRTRAQTAVDLGSAASYAVLAGAGITSTGNTVIQGNVGSYPTDQVNGFPPGTFTGTHTDPATTQAAQSALTTAYNSITAQTGATVLASELGSTTLAPGLYASIPGTFSISTPLTLSGDGLFIFQMGTTLTTSSSILLTNGAQAADIFWQVGSSATLGSATTFEGSILAVAAITLNTGVIVDGRLLAGNAAVSLLSDTISVPTAIPEPAATAGLSAGLLGLVVGARKIRRRLAMRRMGGTETGRFAGQ